MLITHVSSVGLDELVHIVQSCFGLLSLHMVSSKEADEGSHQKIRFLAPLNR